MKKRAEGEAPGGAAGGAGKSVVGWLIAEHIEKKYGLAALRGLLSAYATGASTEKAFETALGRTVDQVDAEFRALETMGCPLLQGYYFARPGPAYPTVTWPR